MNAKTFKGSTLFVTWAQMPDGTWNARCDSEPGWHYDTEPVPFGAMYSLEDRKAAEKSLKRSHGRGLSFDHVVFFGRPAA
jgi:hypothetical protein